MSPIGPDGIRRPYVYKRGHTPPQIDRTPKTEAGKAAAAVRDRAAERQQALDALRAIDRARAIDDARENFMAFVRFTMPDPQDPDDATRSAYDNQYFHDAIAKALEEVEAGRMPFLILTVPPRHGKLAADDTPVLTLAGWKKHGDLTTADSVFGPDGAPRRVLAVSVSGYADRRVTLTDGSQVTVHEAHEWTVWDRSKHRWVTVETRDLETRSLWRGPLNARGGRAEIQMPRVEPVRFPTAKLPLDPYVLGVWLGDGTTGANCLNMAASDRAVWLRCADSLNEPAVERTHPLTGVVNVHFGHGRPGVRGPLVQALHAAGCYTAKHIPDVYLHASVEQRLQLLAGLMDTDGSVDKKTGRCRIVTVLPALVNGVVDLVRGLGWRATVTSQEPALSSGGIQGRQTVVTIAFSPDRPIPTSLPRRTVTRFAKKRRVGVVSVERCAATPGRCIQIDAPDGLYLIGEHLTPTHNSQLTSRHFPAWLLGRNPRRHIVVAAHTDTLAEDFGSDVRAIMQTPQFKQVFPEVTLARGGGAKARLQTHQGGLGFFVGRGAALIGRGADFLILDDLIKSAQEASSQAVRSEVWEWFVKVASTRRMNAESPVIIIMQRWHEDDPVGRITDPTNPFHDPELAAKFKIIDIPALAMDDDVLGRQPGQALWPTSGGKRKFDEEFLAQQRRLDPTGFHALYQQRPSAVDGTLFLRENIHLYAADELPSDLNFYCTSDHAVGTDKAVHDASVLLAGGVDRGGDLWLTDCVWQRWPTDRIVHEMIEMARRRKPLLWAAERGHISKSIGPFLRKRMEETGVFFPLREITPIGNKEARAQSIAGRAAQGKVHLPKHAPWTERAIDELLKFPNGRNDDFVDALAYFGLLMQGMFGGGRAEPKKAAPKTGTFAWVKEHQKRQDRQALFGSSGGY